MKELVDLIGVWRRLPVGTPAVLATVVATQGSTYRRPGARMLLTPDGWAAGSISGGCLEGDVVQSAWSRTTDGPALVTYDSTADEDIVWGFGLGCNGLVKVLFERLPPDGGVLALIADAIEERLPISIATVISPGPRLGDRLPEMASEPSLFAKQRVGARVLPAAAWTCTDVPGYGTVLVERISPPRPLLVFGAGHDAIPLVAAGKALGWHVTVVDGRSAYANVERFPLADCVLVASPSDAAKELSLDAETAAVVMSHHYVNDRSALRELLPSAVGYIGLLGPARRSRRMLDELEEQGYMASVDELARVHAPIGLDLGADGPDEIALAIVAEIQAFFRNRPGGFLNGTTAPLHDGESSVVGNDRREAPMCSLSATGA